MNSSAAAKQLLEQLIDEHSKLGGWNPEISRCASSSAVLESDTATQIAILLQACDKATKGTSIQKYRSDYETKECLKQLLSTLFKRTLPLTEDEVVALLQMVARPTLSRDLLWNFPSAAMMGMLERHVRKHGLSPRLHEPAAAIAKIIGASSSADSLRLVQRIEILLGTGGTGVSTLSALIKKNEVWSDEARANLEAFPGDQRSQWLELIQHAARCSGTKPSKKWLDSAGKLLDCVGRAQFAEHVLRWFPLVGKRGKRPKPKDDESADEAELICTENTEVLKGLVWCCSLLDDENIVSALGQLADACFKKITYHGARCPKVANASVGALSCMTSKEAVAQLGRLQSRAKKASAKGQIDKALQNAAGKAGLTVEDLQEMSVPTYGFEEVGRFATSLGDYSVEILITDPNSCQLRFTTADGKTLKSVPAQVKKDFAQELKALKKKTTEIDQLLPSLRYRIERSLIDQRHWPFAAWKERYLDHPITGELTRRLIWSFNGCAGIWLDGKIVDVSGVPLEIADDSTLVELWHPISSDQDVVQAWRQCLRAHQITQPFKQAHREIYVLTDAELNTATYSNRFAAHIIRQHQFLQLCQQRGWKYTLQGRWDSQNTPVLSLPRWNMQVEFWVDALYDGAASESGVYLYLSTDQVRFTRLNGEAIPLTEVLPIVFTEVMRGVDLFVGVCSIGNDPTWQDHGEQANIHLNYWNTFSFGDLGATAITRKQVLEEIVPHLKIGKQCTFTEKFLVVKGTFRTYKIHYGSGNILMEPNDQYLCIVQNRSASVEPTGNIFLPFEGDATLSIILSKALLLADDSKIKDKTILSQINQKL